MRPPQGVDRRSELVALGVALSRRRHQQGYTLDALAAQSGVSRRTIVNIEHGRINPHVVTLINLAAALRASPLELIDDAVLHDDTGF